MMVSQDSATTARTGLAERRRGRPAYCGSTRLWWCPRIPTSAPKQHLKYIKVSRTLFEVLVNHMNNWVFECELLFSRRIKTCETGDCVLSVKMSVVKTYVRYAPESLQNLPSLNYTEKLQHLQKERLGKNYKKLFSVKKSYFNWPDLLVMSRYSLSGSCWWE